MADCCCEHVGLFPGRGLSGRRGRGGDHGVEGSIVATILIVLLLWPAYRHYRRMEAQRAGTVIPAPAYSKGEPAPSEAPAA